MGHFEFHPSITPSSMPYGTNIPRNLRIKHPSWF
jgi:hypothetical protein